MPLIHNNGKTVNQQDKEALLEMLQGNMQNIIARLEYYRDYTGGRAGEVYNPVIKVYQDGLKDLPEKLRTAGEKPDEIKVADFIQKMHHDMAEKVISTLDPEDDLYPDLQNILFSDMGGMVYPGLAEGLQPEERDMPEKYQDQINDFKLADVPMEGVEDIAEYKPESGRILALYENRAGNSNTLKPENIAKLEQGVEAHRFDLDRQTYNKFVKDLQDAKTAAFGLHAGAEYTRIRSSEMMAKENVTFADVYETFTNINKMARPGDPEAGKLRGTSITAGNLKGPGATAIPMQTYQTLQTIADSMNQIKKTEDPALKKTQAIQLAAFAYQMTLAQHVFNDGNGRTCRLFADSILQTFGLPPHTPTKAESDIMKTIGEEKMDFKKGAEVFLENVKKSDLELKKDPETVIQRLKQEPPEKKPGGIQEKHSLKFSAIYEVNDETVEMLRALKNNSEHAKGRFRDSQEYKDFCSAVDKSYVLALKINQNRGSKDFDMKQADAEYASSIRKLFKTAAGYKDYKLKDHAEDLSANPGKKKLSTKDREKLDLMDSVIENKNLIKVKQPADSPSL